VSRPAGEKGAAPEVPSALRARLGGIERVETITLPIDGPRVLFHGPDGTAWPVTPARAEAELRARDALGGHPLVAPAERVGDALVFPPLMRRGDELERAIDLVSGAPRVREASVRTHLEALGGPVDAVRALGRLGLPRARVDRLLARSVAATVLEGADLGGVMPGAMWSAADRVIAISARYGRAQGTPTLDLASLALRAGLDLDEVHRARAGDATGDGLALALLHEALREVVLAHDDAAADLARALIERFVPIEPARVRVRVDAPPFLPASTFAPVGEVDAAHARALLRDWDGLPVGGSIVRVHCEPPLRRPRRARPFEPREVRRARLFSRWAEGIRVDDEGLFSATPEALAARLVDGLSGVVVDATAGVGSIAIAAARRPDVTRVIAIDLDTSRLALAGHNARVYGVADRIELRAGDAAAIVPTFEADAVVLDPPWGGRDYDRARVGLADLGLDLRPFFALPAALVLKLPRSFDVSELPPGFVVEALVDDRGVLKMLLARRAGTLRPPRT
jgi:trimethylguanosine synthase